MSLNEAVVSGEQTEGRWRIAALSPHCPADQAAKRYVWWIPCFSFLLGGLGLVVAAEEVASHVPIKLPTGS